MRGRLEADGRVEPILRNLHISESCSNKCSILRVKDLTLADQKAAPDDILLFESLAKFFAKITIAGLFCIRESPSSCLEAVGAFLVAEYLSPLLISRTESNDYIPLIRAHSKYLDLKVEDQSLLIQVYWLIGQNSCWFYFCMQLGVHLDAHVAFVVVDGWLAGMIPRCPSLPL